MSNSFPRTLRALHADRSTRVVGLLLLATLLLAAWLAWFLLASITLFEVADTAQIKGAGAAEGEIWVEAQFPARAAGRVQPGQAGRFRASGVSRQQDGGLPVRVESVANVSQSGGWVVRLALEPTATGIPLQPGQPGTVEVAVERLSPAALVFHATGRRVGAEPSQGENR